MGGYPVGGVCVQMGGPCVRGGLPPLLRFIKGGGVWKWLVSRILGEMWIFGGKDAVGHDLWGSKALALGCDSAHCSWQYVKK